MRTFHRLRLLDLVFTPTLVSCPLLYLLPCRNLVIPIRSIICRRFCYAGNDQDLKEYAFGGDGRNRTAVQNTFRVASHNHNQ